MNRIHLASVYHPEEAPVPSTYGSALIIEAGSD